MIPYQDRRCTNCLYADAENYCCHPKKLCADNVWRYEDDDGKSAPYPRHPLHSQQCGPEMVCVKWRERA
jgi:hypothetical protein